MNLNKGLVGHWTMDDRDTDSGIIRDRSPYDNHGVVLGEVISSNDSPINEAFDFDGSTGVVDSNDEYYLDNVSFSAWLNLSATGTRDIFASGGTYYFEFENNDSNIRISHNDPDNNWSNAKASYTGSEWIHFVGQYDGDETSVWINGEKKDQTTDSTGAIQDSGNTFTIGAHDSDPSYPAEGLISEARLYNRALSEKEINALYNMRSSRGFGLKTIGLEYEWYDTQTYYNNNSHPTTESEMDNFFDESNSGVNFGGSGRHYDRIAWHSGSSYQNEPPHYLPADGFSWKVEGQFYAPESGTYDIGLDSDDASDIFINGTNVVNWYDGHATAGHFGHNGSIDLNKGWHTFRARMEEGGGGEGMAVAWQTPSMNNWRIIPNSNFKP